MVFTDDGVRIPSQYRDFVEVFSKTKAETLPPHRPVDHAIDLEPGYKLPYGRIYNPSEFELKTVKAYIETNLANGFIQRSSSAAAAPILFGKKKDGGLRLCVDYRALNLGTVKNRYPLPLISEMLDRVRGARIFIRLDLRNAYHHIRIKEGDEYRTAVRTRYGHFEYRVMPFGLTNAPASFQGYIDDCLRPSIDDFTVCCLDDILIYSTNEKEHEEHVRKVLERLREFGLYCKAEKCVFGVLEVGFLGFVINSEGMSMESDSISTIEDWPIPKSVRDVKVLRGFANFYRRFIRKYAKVTFPLTELLKRRETADTTKHSQKSNKPRYKWEWTRDAELAFQKLKKAFTDAPILQHFDLQKPIILQTDASGFAIAGILNQFDGFGILRPVNFYSRKCSAAEQNYDTYDRELLAIVETMKQWRHYLEGANHKILVQCDHKNLEYFQTSKVLSRRQARWAEILSSYDIVIEHLEGKKNPADGPSRRPDYEIGYERPIARLLATLAATVEPYDDLLPAIKTAQASDSLAADVNRTIVGTPMVGLPDLPRQAEDSRKEWKVTAGALTYKGRIYVPADDTLRSQVISLFHDNPESGHFGALKTADLVSRDFYWPAMDATVRKYVAGCELCHRIRAPCHARHGLNMPLQPPSRPWEGVTMDFVTDLPESTASKYTGILVIVDRLTKMATYLPCRKDIDSPELARMFFEHVICKRGVPDNIVTDRGKEFNSRFWNRVCSHLSINHRLSTAFHPQTDGQTERQNQTMEQYLRAFCNYEQDNWVELFPLAKFAYNNSLHHPTCMTPFWANYHYHPSIQFKPPKVTSNLRTEIRADAMAAGLEETHRLLKENLLEAQTRQSKNAGGKEMTFGVGDKVWLLTRNFRTTRPSKKLDYKRTGPYTVSKIINENAYRLDLPKTMRNHNVFHVSQLDRFTPQVTGQPQSEPNPIIVDDLEEEWEVDRILDSKRRYRKLHYLVQWAGYNYIHTSWEPFENLENAQELINDFHRDHPHKPRR